MIFNQLNVLPTSDTSQYLAGLASGSALELDLTLYQVEIMLSTDDIVPAPSNVYQARPLNLRVWYDPYLQRSSLILSLESPDLMQRAVELANQGVLRAFFDYYNPHLTLKAAMPPLSSNYRRAVLALANALVANERPLEFTSEFVTQVDLEAAPDAEYNKAMFMERQGQRLY